MNITCEHCSTVFPSPISISGGTATLRNNHVRCPNPKCRKMTKMQEGKFKFDSKGNDTLIASLSDLDLSVEQLKSMSDFDNFRDVMDEESFAKKIESFGIDSNSILNLKASGMTIMSFISSLVFAVHFIIASYGKVEQVPFQNLKTYTENIFKQAAQAVGRSSSENYSEYIAPKIKPEKKYDEAEKALHEARKARQKYNRSRKK